MEISSYIKNCFEMFAFSENAFKNIKQKANLGTAFSVYLILLLISTLIQFANILIDPMQYGGFGIVASLMLYIGMIILTVIFYFILIAIVHLFFKLFKGKGTIGDTLRGMLAVAVPVTMFSIAISLITLPFAANSVVYGILSLVFGGLGFALAVYTIAVEIKLFTYIHEISIGKSAAAVLLPYIILVVLAIVLAFIFIAIIGTSMFI